MNRQTLNLLSILVSAPGKYLSYQDLSQTLKVSTRSVRNYVNYIQTFLENLGKKNCLCFQEGGMSFVGGEKDAEYILRHSIDDDFYLYHLSPEERILAIYLILLLEDSFLSAASLEERFKISKNTVLKDMDGVRNTIFQNGFSFKLPLNKGYCLQCTEAERRAGLQTLFESFSENDIASLERKHILLKIFASAYHYDEVLVVLRNILLKEEQRANVPVSDKTFERVLTFSLIQLVRILDDHTMADAPEAYRHALMLPTASSARCLAEEAGHIFSCTYSETEIGYLSSFLYQNSFYNLMDMENARDMELHIAVSSFLHKVGREILIPIQEDTEIAAQLERHLKDITRAIKNGKHFTNEYTDTLIANYQIYYAAIRKHIKVLESYAGFTFDTTMLSFVLMYVVVAAENFIQGNLIPKVIVVCHTGVGTANFLAQRLKAYFRLHICAVTSKHMLKEVMTENQFDLIVSTISLNKLERPWLKISPLLDDRDVLSLQKRLMEIADQKAQTAHLSGREIPTSTIAGTIEDLFSSEKILLDQKCDSWESAIRISAGPLLQNGCVEPRYVDAIIQSARENGAYFVYCPHVALAHAGPNDGILHFGISILRLSEPIAFNHKNNDPVSYVICMAVQKEPACMKRILSIMDLFSREDEKEKLNRIKDKTFFADYINKRVKEIENGKLLS